MVKRGAKASISEEEGTSEVLNGSGTMSSEPAKKRLKTKSLYRQPTANELNRLQETENLFNSNLFRLQIEEILQEVKLKEKTEKKFQTWFEGLRKHLESIPDDDAEYDLTEKTFIKKLKVKLPVSKKLDRTKCVFRFHKFKNVEIVGSHALGCPINSKLTVDVQITVPAETYTKNDSVNYRYHKKRAAYLAYIASHLKTLESIEDLKYSWVNGCQTKPVLDFKPNGKLGNHLSVRIHLACESEAYKLHRFSPGRNNLREAWLLLKENVENSSEVGPPTAYYNSSVLSDLTASSNMDFLTETLRNSENLKQAVVLLKIWLRQRKLQVSGFVISLLVAHLVQTKRINNIMSSYQIIRNVWISLKTSQWDTTGISLHKDTDSPPLSEFLNHFPVVFLDTTGYYNVCWQMTSGTYAALKREAALAVNMLDDGSVNSFIPLFMTPVTPLLQFDYILRFQNFPKLKQAVLDKAPIESKVNYGTDQLALVTKTLYTLLARGLGDRADLILPLIEADFSWPVGKSYEKVKDGFEEKLAFGFILNEEHALNITNKGPAANLPQAEEFRAFWGDKSELRRFQDGSITETCVWEGDTLAERRAIPRQVVEYLLKLKYDIPPSELFHVLEQLASLTTRKQYTREKRIESEESALAALQAADDLRRDLRGLTQLPLEISAVYGTSPVFSYCDPTPPLPSPPFNPWRRGGTCLVKHIENGGVMRAPEFTPVCETVLELGHSGKWPGELEAFRCLKAAFNLQIADRLNKQFNLPTHAYPTHIDVLKNGLVFRLIIAHPKEITLLRRTVENGVVKFKESAESIRFQRETVLLPRLRGALHGLHQRHPSFGVASCLLQRFLSAHLLSPPHIPAITCSLLTARVYTAPAPHSAPASPQLGLLRTLRLLSETNWPSEMLLIDFNGDMKREYDVTARVYTAPAPHSAPASPQLGLLRTLRLLSETNWPSEMLLIDFNGDMKREYDVTARVYTAPAPHSAPASPQLGLLRTLRLLSETNWPSEMLLIDFNGDMKREYDVTARVYTAPAPHSAPASPQLGLLRTLRLLSETNWPSEMLLIDFNGDMKREYDVTARVYTAPAPHSAPASPQLGLLRTLRLLSETNWPSEMLLIDFNGDMKREYDVTARVYTAPAPHSAPASPQLGLLRTLRLLSETNWPSEMLLIDFNGDMKREYDVTARVYTAPAPHSAPASPQLGLLRTLRLLSETNWPSEMLLIDFNGDMKREYDVTARVYTAPAPHSAPASPQLGLLRTLRLLSETNWPSEMLLIDFNGDMKREYDVTARVYTAPAPHSAPASPQLGLLRTLRLLSETNWPSEMLLIDFNGDMKREYDVTARVYTAPAPHSAPASPQLGLLRTLRLLSETNWPSEMLLIDFNGDMKREYDVTARVYTAPAPHSAPASPQLGLLRTLRLLSETNWPSEMLLIDFNGDMKREYDVTARVYTAPAPHSAPASPQLGLLRTLRLLSETNWPSEMLLIDFNGDMKREYDVTARVYTAPAPHSAPASPQLGLLRTLRLLSETNWPSEMLLIDFNGDMKREYDVTARVYTAPAPHSAPASPQLGLLRTLRLLSETNWPSEMLLIDFNGDMKREYDVTARVYTAPAPHSAPASPQLGLLRTLRLLSETNWPSEMLLIDFNGDMKREEILELETKFATRDATAPYMYIATSYDGDLPSIWTASAPNKLTVLRAQILARNTLSYMEDKLMRNTLDNVLSAFVPSYAGYDVLIHLHASLTPYVSERVDVKPRPRALPEAKLDDDVIPVVAFNPVQKYLDELRSAYSEFALFFHDYYGGEVVAVLWKPDIGEYKEFQVSNASALRPITKGGETKYKVNIAAIVEDFKLLGAGLVRDVVVNT